MSRGLHNLHPHALIEKLREKDCSLTNYYPYFWGCGGMVDAADLKSVDRIGRESSSLSTPIFQMQYYKQMRDKFGLDFPIVNRDLMCQFRRRRGLHINQFLDAFSPFNHLSDLKFFQFNLQ